MIVENKPTIHNHMQQEILQKTSIIIPAKNEGGGLGTILAELRDNYPDLGEIIVVNDGSTDNTSEVCEQFNVTEIKHPLSLGNGAAIKSGMRYCKTDYALMMDADGQHPVADIKGIVDKFRDGYDMVVAARKPSSHANLWRRFANAVYQKLATYITNHKILDLTSGFRMVKVKMFKQFLYLYPNGFSYPTTSTMAFLRNGYSVAFFEFEAVNRQKDSNSHISIINDGIKFLLIIFRIGTLYSPLKIFIPLALVQFILGIGNYAYTYIEFGRFTNMSALLLTSALLVFLIGLVSEQITALLYNKAD